MDASSDTAPIAQLLPLGLSAASGVYFVARTIVSYVYAAAALLLTPITLVVPALAFVLAPLIASVRLATDVLLAPYHAAVFVSQALYPIYVLAGSALLCGVILGLGARYAVGFTRASLRPFLAPSAKERSVSGATRGRIDTRPAQAQPVPILRAPSKGKKRVSVKFERDA